MFYVEKDLDYTFKFSHSFYIYCKRYRGRLKKSEFFTLHANGSCKIDNGRYVTSNGWIVLSVRFF